MNGGGFQMGKMPKSVTCYICGRGYGTRSISIHLKSCQKKWDIEQMKKPKKQRKPCPQPPRGFNEVINKKNINRKDLEQLNNDAYENYDQQVLEKCQFCNRTFNPEAFVRHNRICTADKPMNPLKKNIMQMKKQKELNKGLKQSTNILQNTTSQNIQKQNFNSNNEKIQQIQQTNPQFEQEEEYKENQDLEQCTKCNRKFFADRLQKHMNVCKGNTKQKSKPKPVQKQLAKKKQNSKKDPKWKQQHNDLMETMKYMKKVAQAEKEGKSLKNLPPPPKSRNPNFLECPSCNRTFNPTAHERHVKTCANIVNRPKMLKRKNYGKNNRGYQLHLKFINSVIMRSQSHQTYENIKLQNSINSSQNLRLSIKANKKKIKLTDSQLPKANKLQQKFIKSNKKTQLNLTKLKKNKKIVAKIQQTNKKKMSNKNFDSLQNYFQMIMKLQKSYKNNDVRQTFSKQKQPLKNLFCQKMHKKIRDENLINKPKNKSKRCSVNPKQNIETPQPRLSTKAGRKIYSLNPMLDKEDKENRYPVNKKIQDMYFRQCQRKLDFNKFSKCLQQAYQNNVVQLPQIQKNNINLNNSKQKFGGTNFSYVQKMNIINPFKKPKHNTSYRLGFYKNQYNKKVQQNLKYQFENYKIQQTPKLQQNPEKQKDLNFTFSNFPNN